MASKIYEIRVYRDDREVRGVNPFITGIDLDDADATTSHLNRHLLGAALRSGAKRADVHHFHLEGRAVDPHGKGVGQVLFRWVHPAIGGDV